MTVQDLDNMFTYHPPQGDQSQRYAEIRAQARSLAVLIFLKAPKDINKQPPRETLLAIEKIQEAVMWANAGIAVNEVLK